MTPASLTPVELWTDGACRGNPGPGGWAAILISKGQEKILSGSEALTTNNRMELTAAIRGLEALTRRCLVLLHTDSQYVMKGITEWLPDWKRRDWRTADRKPVKNVDLWQELDAQVQRHRVDWRWVRGHAGVARNEQVDRLANEAIDRMLGK
jgi:ribonuclease HI